MSSEDESTENDETLGEEEQEDDKSKYDEEQGEEKDDTKTVQSIKVPVNKVLYDAEASQCLSLLGKDESGMHYAYLMMSVVDRGYTDISVIPTYKHLLFLNVSGNNLTLDRLQCLTDLPFLLLLQCDRNAVESCQLKEMKYLQVLTLNNNKITSPDGIKQPLLECLELNHNFIESAKELDPFVLKHLKVLELRGNKFTKLSGINFTTIDSLYIADNRINDIDDLSAMVNLRVLHLRENFLVKLKGFSAKLTKLQYINVRTNKIDQLKRLNALRCLPNLETLILMQNPVMGIEDELRGEDENDEDEDDDDEDKEEEIDPIRIEILYVLPRLKRLNKKFVTAKEIEALGELKEEKGIYKEEEDSVDEAEIKKDEEKSLREDTEAAYNESEFGEDFDEDIEI